MPATYQQLPRLASRLQPDSSGRDIPLDATWTKIRRTLVSPEVLARAGVRYEARPDFVAVLGELSKAQISEYARQSAEVRRQRMGGNSFDAGRGKGFQPPRYMRGGDPDGLGLRDEKPRSGSTTSDEESVLWDESDTSSDEDKNRRRSRARRGDASSKADDDSTKDKKRSDSQDDTADEEKGTKVYPFVLPMSSATEAKNGADGARASPASTVAPKPILKNRNENHVRFDREGPIEISPEDMAADQRRRERDRKDRERDREQRDKERERDRERRRRDRDRDPDRYRERERSRDREYSHRHRHPHSGDAGSSSRRNRDSHSTNGGNSSRDRDSARREKKKAWGQTLGAAGIGGAAASLLSVLTEAASGF